MTIQRGMIRLARTIGIRGGAALALLGVSLALVIWGAAAVLARLGWWSWARWVPALLWLLVVAGGAWLVRAINRRRPRARQVAALVEQEQGLRRGTLVGLYDIENAVPAGTSRDLAERAGARLAGALPGDPDAWAPRRSREEWSLLRRRGALAGGALVLAALGFWYAGDAAAMLASPVRALRHVLAPRVAISASAAAVPAGGRVTVTVQAEPGTTRASLRLRERGEGWSAMLIDLDAAGRGSHVVAIESPTFVYAEASGRSSDTLSIEVIRPLVLGDFAITAHYPAYLEREDEPLDPGAGVLAVPVGTSLSVRGLASAPLAGASLQSERETRQLRVTGSTFEGRVGIRADVTWRLVLADRRGGTLDAPPVIAVRAVPDSVPVVTVPVPGQDTTAPLDLKPAIVIDARDDHGLNRVQVVSWRISRLGVVGDTVVDSLPGVTGADRIVQTEMLDLSARGLLPGDTLRFYVRAQDRSPAGQWGRSRAFALRLRSVAEMRDAVRRGADSLAAQAAALAAEQTQLGNETRDLAAQRNRAGERTQSRPDARDAARTTPPANMNFEQAEAAQRLAEQQDQLLRRADSLRADLQQLAEAAREAGLSDPEWQRQLAELDRLLQQALTPELMQRLDELRRALQSLDPRQVQDALRRMAEQQQQLRDELRRSAELFERAAIEGSMQTAAQEAEQIRQEQQQWNERAAARRDSLQAAQEQARLQQMTDSLQAQLEQLEQRLEQRGDSAAAQAAGQSAEQVERAGQQMQRAQQAMRSGQRSEAADAGQRAADQLSSVPQTMQEASQQLASNWRSEVLERLGRATHETVQLAMEEARLAQEMRQGSSGNAEIRGRQSAIEQGISQAMRNLQQAAGSNALVSPRLGSQLAQAREQVARSRQALEGPSPSAEEASERAQEAARTLAQAAQQMIRNAEEVGGSQSGSGLAEALERMGQLAGQQGQLNDQLGGLIPMLGSGDEAVRQQLRQLAERQRQLANQMERLGGDGMPGRPDQLAEEARLLADRMEQGRLDRATLDRQQRLFRRMLDAGRQLRNDEEPEDPERQSRTGEARAAARPGAVTNSGLRYPPPAWSELRNLSPEERAVVLEYFRRLNAQP